MKENYNDRTYRLSEPALLKSAVLAVSALRIVFYDGGQRVKR